MNANDLRLLADIYAGLPSTFYDVPVAVEGLTTARDIEVGGSAHTKGVIEASDLPDDLRTLIDAVPRLRARILELEAKVDEVERRALSAICGPGAS